MWTGSSSGACKNILHMTSDAVQMCRLATAGACRQDRTLAIHALACNDHEAAAGARCCGGSTVNACGNGGWEVECARGCSAGAAACLIDPLLCEDAAAVGAKRAPAVTVGCSSTAGLKQQLSHAMRVPAAGGRGPIYHRPSGCVQAEVPFALAATSAPFSAVRGTYTPATITLAPSSPQRRACHCAQQ